MMVADSRAEQRSMGGTSGPGRVVYGLGGGICPYALNLASHQHTSKKGTYHSTIRDHPNHQSTPFSFLALGTQFKDMSAIGPKSSHGQDLGPSWIFGVDLDVMPELELVLGKGDTKDGRFRSFVTAKMGRVDIDVVNMSKVGSELDYHPIISHAYVWDVPIKRRVMSSGFPCVV